MTATTSLSRFRSERPAGAYDDHVARVLPQALAHPAWSPSDGPLPSLFVSHGAPFTLDDPHWTGHRAHVSRDIVHGRVWGW